MNTQQIPNNASGDTVTFTLRKSTKNTLIAKVIIFLGLTFVFGYFYARSSAEEYEKGRELTEEKYLANYDEYKASLIKLKGYDNPVIATLIMFLGFAFFIGSYELAVLIVSFLIGKIAK